MKVIAKICMPTLEAAALVRFLMKIRRPPPEEAAALNKVFVKN